MKFSAALLSLALVFAGTANAAHISNLQHTKRLQQRGLGRRTGPSATYTSASATNTATSTGTATSSSASSTSTAAFSSGIKRGLSYNDASLTESFTSADVSWAYNWGSSASGSLPDGVIFIPMLWGTSDTDTNSWSSNAQSAIENGATYLLGFNEPDDSSQANLTPEAAAQAWLTYMEPFAGKALLVSPAVTNGAPPSMGTGWMDEFLGNCTSCTIDALAFHIYDDASNEAYYKDYISSLVSTYDKPIWVTELGATGSDSDIQTFLGDMVSYLDDLEGLATYAWFMDEVGNLVNSDGSLTSLADTYISSSS